jgi:periplasmic protein CpxP/Spy
MNKLKIYQWATLGLLLLNLAILCFFVFTKPIPPKGINPKLVANQEMDLTNEQHKLFLASAEKHKQQITALENQQETLWQSYFKTLSIANVTTENDTIILQLQSIEKQKIEITSTHFSEVKAFLKPYQYKGFSIFLQHLLDRNFKKEKNISPPPKDF